MNKLPPFQLNPPPLVRVTNLTVDDSFDTDNWVPNGTRASGLLVLPGNRAAPAARPRGTQNAASQPNGRGPAIEMLNCLRYTDAPHVAGLLYPSDVVIAGDFPWTYE